MSISSNLSSIGAAAFFDCPLLTEIEVGKMAVTFWPWLLWQLGNRRGLFGDHTAIDIRKRRSFVLSFLRKHVTQLFEGGSLVGKRAIKRGAVAPPT
jgi:hypothetical protein